MGITTVSVILFEQVESRGDPSGHNRMPLVVVCPVQVISDSFQILLVFWPKGNYELGQVLASPQKWT